MGFQDVRAANARLSAIESGEVIRSPSAAQEVEGAIDPADEKGGPVCRTAGALKIRWKVLGVRT
jgi:hypothetical protein